MPAQTGIATGLTSPGFAQPTINLQVPSVMPPLFGPIPKVKSTDEALRYPAQRGNEDVLFDENDPQIAYFRSTDANGYVQVDRRRCISEPEPTPEEIADQRYLSRGEFSSFIDSFNQFREEMMSNVRELTKSVQTATTTTAVTNSADAYASYYANAATKRPANRTTKSSKESNPSAANVPESAGNVGGNFNAESSG